MVKQQTLETLTRCRALLQVWQRIDGEFPLQYMLCLIEIAADEGLSLSDLATRTHMPLSTVSRIVGALSDHRKNGKSYGLIRVDISATERRRKELSLTPKGRSTIIDISKILILKREQTDLIQISS